jgi:translation initiation factor IF-3
MLKKGEKRLNYSKKIIKGHKLLKTQSVRLIDESGTMLGVMPLHEAQSLAQQKGLDLIEIPSDSEPPICKIADYGRLRYQEQKKKTEMKKKQHVSTLKEIQLRPNIQENDYLVKIQQARQFLINRDRVKVSLQFRGREISFVELGQKIVTRVIADLADVGKVEGVPKLDGKKIIATLVPITK